MADATVSVVLELLLSIAKEKIESEIQLVRGVDKELEDLSQELTTIRNVLDDADRRQFSDKTVKDWLWRLEQTSYEMEDVLEEWNYAIRKHKMESESTPNKMVCSLISSSCFCFKKLEVRHDIAKKVKNLKSRLDEILEERDRYNFVISEPSPASRRVQSTSLIDLAEVQGGSHDRDILVSKLSGNHLSYHVVSIVGAGGLGKTTLAQQVYNHSGVTQCFDYRIWICVSDPFDVATIAMGIINGIDKNSSPDATQLDALLNHLIGCISGKNILLVLDDVWNEESDKWEPLRNALKCGGASCKILVTTRKVQVARIMGTVDEDIICPELLSDEDCWLLLRNSAFLGRSENEFESFEEIGRSIAKKCNGLPLAAKTLGGLLRFKNAPHEWEKVLNSEMWGLKQVEVELFPHLLLSYHELSPMLKGCFSYCAFYPKDKNLKVVKLIRKWMALGYLGSTGDDMELKGREYFEDLAMRSLFQDFKKDGRTGQITSCKMHDIVHEFARFLRKAPGPGTTKRTCQVCNPNLVSRVKEFRSLSWDEKTPPNICDCITSLRVLEFGTRLNGSPPGMEKLIHLRWLDMGCTQLLKEDVKTICKLYFLQTLLLSYCSLKEIPGEIGNLFQLRHLDLSGNEELRELPESIGSLYELQSLLLEDCSLKDIPTEIGNLVHLRHLNLLWNGELKELPESMCSLIELQTLDIQGCSNLYGLPDGLAQLTGLHTLSEFHGGSGCNKLGLLKNLNSLSESLKLYIRCGSTISDMEELVEDAQEAEIRKMINLQKLEINFLINEIDKDEKERSSSLWVDLIEALQPNHNLEYLEIRRYEGLRLPHWISSPLNLVRDIELYDCSELSSLPLFGKLPFLERLYMMGLKELKSVGVEWLGIRGGEVMMKDIPSSSSSSSSSAATDHVVDVHAFPKLMNLSFESCSKWEEWEDITEEEEESAAISIMPCLTYLKIRQCRGLKMLPHRLMRKAKCLKVLDISWSTELENCYGDKDGSLWKSITNTHPQLKLKFIK